MSKNKKGFSEGVKIVAVILLVTIIALIIILVVHKFMGKTDTTGTEIMNETSGCILKSILGQKC